MAALLFFVGVLQIAGYYFAGALVNGDGPLAAPQPDTLLYCQAARRIVEGHPFSFSAGTAVSTGTTSVLYPFVLAVPYWLGAKGDSLMGAGFALNAFFYLVFLFAWARAFCVIFDRPAMRYASVLLLALSPQPAYCSLAQSDIGLWLAVSGLFAACFFAGRLPAYAALLVLGPWIRPEGMVLVVAFCVYAAFVRKKGDFIAALLGVASTAGVFAFNYALTGKAQFSSVARKGYFTMFGFSDGLVLMVTDMAKILKGFVLGLSDSSPRLFFVIPLFGALCIVWGVFVHRWRGARAAKLCALSLAVAGGFATVAMSGWQNTNVDRYLAWTFPVVALFLAEGAVALGDRVKSTWCRRALAALPLLYAAAMSFVMFTVFNGTTRDTSLLQDFSRHCERCMPQGASVGSGSCGFAYELSDRRVAHLSGIYSPEFEMKSRLTELETLKHEPQTRFDYWMFEIGGTGYSPGFLDVVGDSVAVGPLGMELRKADWSAFDRAARHVPPGGGRRLRCRVDVGYEKDEERFSYRIEQRYRCRPFDPMLKVAGGPDGGGKIVEVARMVAGYDEMSVPLAPGLDAKVVMRTYSSCDVMSRGAFMGARVKYEISNPARLNLSVDGRVVGEVSYACPTNGFSDVTFDIPGSAITASPCNVAFLGDHIACTYWFYQ